MRTREGRPRIVVTRPTLTAAPLRRAIRRRGAEPLGLPGLALEPAADPADARRHLRAALSSQVWIFTSPAAVHFAWTLVPDLRLPQRISVVAVGRGTAQALARVGVTAIAPAGREDSEGMLALPVLGAVEGQTLALIGAPGGRGLLAPALHARGATVQPVHVYRRTLPMWRPAQIDAFCRAEEPLATLVSSGEALDNLSRHLPPPASARLRGVPVVVSSERLAGLARDLRFGEILVARSPAPADLLDTALARLQPGGEGRSRTVPVS